MKLFKKLFAEKLLRFYEGTNAGIRYISSAPVLKNHIKEETFAEGSRARLAVGIAAQFFMILWEFIKKFMYVFVLIYIPYRIISIECPLIRANQELTIIYMFIMLSIICGSLSNNILFTVGDRDYLMMRVMFISPYMNFLGKLIYKMVTEFVFYFITLNVFGVTPLHSLLFSYTHIKWSNDIIANISPIGLTHIVSMHNIRECNGVTPNTFNVIK